VREVLHTNTKATFCCACCLNGKIVKKTTTRVTATIRRMTDSIGHPGLPLPQIRPASNNTIDTDRSLNAKNGRK
jgi:hypothetical protein